jgi:hypothetical protein
METAVEWLVEQMKQRESQGLTLSMYELEMFAEQANKMFEEQELKIKIICWKEALQLIDDNYMAELINIRIYNMEQELLTFKSE